MIADALVIGSGPNGLAAAITLARAGRPVTVLEAAPRAGGAVTTEELTLPGFHHDTFSSVYPAPAASPVFERYPLERHGLSWVHPDASYAHPLEDGRGAALYRDLDRTGESLERLAPGQGEGWLRFAGPFVERFDALRRTMLSGFPPLAGPARLATGIGRSTGRLNANRMSSVWRLRSNVSRPASGPAFSPATCSPRVTSSAATGTSSAVTWGAAARRWTR